MLVTKLSSILMESALPGLLDCRYLATGWEFRRLQISPEKSAVISISESHLFVRVSLAGKKPVSLTYRCPCRFYESNVARANIKHLKILSTPNCSLQIVARLKSNSKQVCIDPKLKWIQEYLEKALNKPRHRTHKKKQQKKRGPLCPSRATPLKSPGRKNGGSRCKRQAM
ncbi:PREDICTED: stromal cell-derived factor 1 [Nestor notabilis]|uniref:stromal cell-derived factor 1 n=1 Tax=Nestor notabilis TaxID=176057 RepID=UPI00052365B6|nr:PREDICTED: stromal cell-derived factor 1 [Nestor notabilis]